MIIKSNRELKARYHELSAGDAFIGNLSLKHLKQTMLIDMLERGIDCLPSAISQILNSSKVAQAFVLRDWMLPHTLVIPRRKDLIEAVNTFNKHRIGPVVTKQNRMHCGHGIRRWENIETLYSFMAFSKSSYPFVLQPLQMKFTDIRVIIVADFVEAYSRYNPQYNRETIQRTLEDTGIAYAYAGDYLGGRPNDPVCYENEKVSYHLVAARPWFRRALARLIEIASEKRTAIMCVEEDPNRCHRHHLVAQALLQEGKTVWHIRGDGRLEEASPRPPQAEQLSFIKDLYQQEDR